MCIRDRAEIGNDYINCLLSEGDFDVLKAKLFEIINNDNLIEQLEQNAYKLVKKFKWSQSFEKFEEIITN